MNGSKVSAGRTLRRFFWDIYDNLGILILSNLLSFFLWLFLSFSLWLLLISPLRLALTPFLSFRLLTFLPFLFSLPVASAGLFYVSHLIISREGVRVRDFFLGLKRYFVRGLLLGLIISFLLILVSSSISFYHQIGQEGKRIAAVLGGMNIWLFFLFFLMEMYSFPLIVEQNITLGKALKRSALLALDNPFFTMAISVEALAIAALCLFSGVGIPLLVMGLVSLLFSRALKELRRKYEGKEEREEKEEERRSLREIIRPWE